MQYRLIVEYDGTDFRGWQIQPGARTVQAALEDALARLLGRPTRVAAAGRTDAGVHAAGQVVCFHTEREISPAALRRAHERAHARSTWSCALRTRVADDFDPRRGARCRRYVYRIWNRRRALAVLASLRLARALAARRRRRCDRAAGQLVGEHDFSSFRAAGCDAVHPVRRVLRSEVARRGDLLVYEIEATAFLRHMVRNIAGTLVEIGSGRRGADVAALLAARDRRRAAATAPPHGLCLVEIRY